MRLKFEFEIPKGTIELPASYNYHLQSMIYKSISAQLSDFLHNQGYAYEKRSFKLFTFSRLYGKYRIIKKSTNMSAILFHSPVSFYLSSPVESILQEFANRMAAGTVAKLNGNAIFLSSVQVFFPPVIKEPQIKIKFISPLCIRSTLFNKMGSKKTYYYMPQEKEFSELIGQNLLKKYIAYHNHFPPHGQRDFTIKPVHFDPVRNFHLLVYKGIFIRAYDGIFEISGSDELKRFAYDVGLGERNCQGFGMFEIWQEKKINETR